MNNTGEFSFILKPSAHGIGVFAAHDISAGAHLRLFGDETVDHQNYRVLSKESVPAAFQGYCAEMEEGLYCPLDFGVMHIGWYMNHSATPNAAHRQFIYYALRDIKAGEEITIDYNSIGEPEEARESYYQEKPDKIGS